MPGWFKWLNGPAGQALGTESTSISNQLNPIDVHVGIITGTRCTDPWFTRLFHSKNAGKVSVERAKLAEMQDFLECPLGHTFIMRDPFVIEQIKTFLSEARFEQG